jgi:hypothetical protein
MTLDELEVCPFCGREKVEWISVKDRLPEHDERVLACYSFNTSMQFIQVLDYYATDPVPHFQHELGTDGMKVTHWMPLPEPPKGE